MLDNFWPYLFRIMSFLSGLPFQPAWELKVRLIAQAGLFLLIFCIIFFYVYRKYFWQEKIHRQLLFLFLGVLGLVIIAKFVIFYLTKGYIPDRLLFFAIPSPKFSSVSWALLSAVAFGFFLTFRKRSENWSARKFLIFLWLVFWAFSLGIAGMRMGAFGIYEPFTRSFQDYAGDLPLVQSIPKFLHDYAVLNPKFSLHGRIHPPGNTLVLYIIKELLNTDFFSLAILVAMLGSAFIFPVYYFWRRFFPEAEVRAALPVFIFTPSLVLFSVTSMDIVLLVSVWTSLVVVYFGWENNWLAAFAGGVSAGLSLFLNFLFLLFAPVFLFFFVYLWRQSIQEYRQKLIFRTFWSLVGFFSLFVFVYLVTGYSIVENFLIANSAQHTLVISSFTSLPLYFLFACMNIVAFSFYLGIPHTILLLKKTSTILNKQEPLLALGFVIFLFFVALGVFQGEVERIWLFITPFFLPSISGAVKRSGVQSLAVILLLVFQIVIIQTLFYTYW